MFKSKFKLITAVLVALAMLVLGFALFLHHRRIAELDAAKDKVMEAKLQGEWFFWASRERPDDSEIVWTFRPNGIFRVDGVDRESRKQIRGAVGLWQVEKGDVRLVWEVWHDRHLCPFQSRERYRIQAVSASELVLQELEVNDRFVEHGEELRFKRFAGWPRKTDDEGPNAFQAFSDFFRQLANKALE